ncbi:MAG: hypothetical protein ABIT83_14685 [Massilia sp.]
MGFDLGNVLQQYMGGDPGNQQRADSQQAIDDFDRVAEAANHDQLASGVSEALRSDQTPPFSQLVGQLFDRGNADQRAGMLNQLLGGVGPGLLSSLAGGALGSLFRGHEAPAQITPEQAATMSPDQISQIAAEAERHNPSVVDRMGGFYAQHPNLVKGLGGAALAIALGHMAQGMRR